MVNNEISIWQEEESLFMYYLKKNYILHCEREWMILIFTGRFLLVFYEAVEIVSEKEIFFLC